MRAAISRRRAAAVELELSWAGAGSVTSAVVGSVTSAWSARSTSASASASASVGSVTMVGTTFRSS